MRTIRQPETNLSTKELFGPVRNKQLQAARIAMTGMIAAGSRIAMTGKNAVYGN